MQVKDEDIFIIGDDQHGHAPPRTQRHGQIEPTQPEHAARRAHAEPRDARATPTRTQAPRGPRQLGLLLRAPCAPHARAGSRQNYCLAETAGANRPRRPFRCSPATLQNFAKLVKLRLKPPPSSLSGNHAAAPDPQRLPHLVTQVRHGYATGPQPPAPHARYTPASHPGSRTRPSLAHSHNPSHVTLREPPEPACGNRSSPSTLGQPATTHVRPSPVLLRRRGCGSRNVRRDVPGCQS